MHNPYPQFLLFLLIFTYSCTSETPKQESPDTDKQEEKTVQETSPVAKEPTKLIVALDNYRLREKPGPEGKEIARLPLGTILTDQGELSEFTTRLKLRGVQFDEPWIKVKTETGIEGWVYGGGINFSMDNPSLATKTLLQYRLKALFGKEHARRIEAYQQAYHDSEDSQAFIANYREGAALREVLVGIIENKIEVEDYDRLPNLFWLEQALPGYVPQLVAEGTIYYLFQDYTRMEQKVRKTKGMEDDDYIEFCMAAHSLDSVEHFFPSWFLQTWDYGGASLLGQGVHLRLLEKIEAQLAKSTLFEKELLDYKSRILEDISNPETMYWEPIDKIKKEMDDIEAAGLSILTAEDKTALQTRRKMFDDPQANKIQVNQKAG